MTLGSLIAALALIGGAVATLDMPVPKPAWKSDVSALERSWQSHVTEVERYAQNVDKLATEQALEAVQLRLYRNLAEQDKWREQGKSVPDYLRSEQVALESKKRRLERRLRRLEE